MTTYKNYFDKLPDELCVKIYRYLYDDVIYEIHNFIKDDQIYIPKKPNNFSIETMYFKFFTTSERDIFFVETFIPSFRSHRVTIVKTFSEFFFTFKKIPK